MVAPGPRRFEKRRQVATGSRPHSSGGSSARKRLSSKNLSLGAGGEGNRVILLANAMVRSCGFPRLFGFPRKEADDLLAELDQRDQPRPRYLEHLRVPAVDQFGELKHLLQTLGGHRADRGIVGGIRRAG